MAITEPERVCVIEKTCYACQTSQVFALLLAWEKQGGNLGGLFAFKVRFAAHEKTLCPFEEVFCHK